MNPRRCAPAHRRLHHLPRLRLARRRREALAVSAGGLLALALVAPLAARAQEKEVTTSGRRRTTTTTTISTTLQRESARRQARASEAEDHLARGDAAYALKDYETATREYKIAVDSLNLSPAAGDRRTAALAKFTDASLKLAQQRIIEGRYADAENALKIVIRPEYDPTNKPVLRELQRLEDPEDYNQTVTPKFIDRVETVKKLFVEAQGYYDSARFDLAFKRYEQILALDPTNIAARKGQEKVDLARHRYDEHAQDENRGRSLEEVTRSWARPVRRYGVNSDPLKGVRVQRDEAGSTVAINAKLRELLIPSIEFRQTTLRDAVEFLRQEARRLDPQQVGVNIFLKLPAPGSSPRPAVTAPATPLDNPPIPGIDNPASQVSSTAITSGPTPTADSRISLSLNNIPLLEALRYVAQQAGLKVRVEPFAVAIVPAAEETATLIQAEFRVPPGFVASTVAPTAPSALSQGATSAGGGAGGGGVGGGTRDVSGAGSNSIVRQDARTFLESNGVTFPPGASATYVAQGSRLVVRNTQENIDLIQALVESNAPDVLKQVEIESKFVEVTQNDLKELSFNLNLGSANIPGNQRVFLTGGTGTTPGNTAPTAANDLNSGLRSGGLAIQGNAIDALLLGTGGVSGASAAAGILNLFGVATDPQFQLIIRALNQQKGVDLLSAPRVTTKSGQKAVIEIIREFIYPTQFQPPQIPTQIGNNNNGNGGAGVTVNTQPQTFPVTPTTPTAFEKRNTGVTLDVQPTIGPDGFTIDLTLSPQVVDFEGFINYGSPIYTVSNNLLGVSTRTALTDNVINQPIFSTRKVTTSVSVYDGSTVILGGLTREDVQKVNDKVPVLGDVPLVGRLFRSKVDQNIKRNLIIFVTARLIDPAGQPINTTEETEEEIVPLSGPDQFVQPLTLPPPLPKK